MNWSRAVQAIGILVLLLVVGTFVIQAFPSLVGADYALTVQSGSMEPAISTGSVVFVEEQSPAEIAEGDIITYQDEGGTLVTHRVIEIHRGQTSVRFVTKGDNNDNRDPEPVYRDEILGKATFSLPLIGYAVAFGKSPLGWGLTVLIPTMLLVMNEIWTLYTEMTTEKEEL